MAMPLALSSAGNSVHADAKGVQQWCPDCIKNRMEMCGMEMKIQERNLMNPRALDP